MKKLLLLLLISNSILFVNAQAITEEILPQYIQGTVTSGNIGRVPFTCRLTLTGLTPSVTYRYITRAVLTTNSATNGGAGNSIFVPTGTGSFVRPGTSPSNFSTSTDYAEFTTNSSGSYTGWFILEPTANSTRFVTGVNLHFLVITNDGAGGTAFVNYLRTPNTFKVINYGTTTAADSATGIRSTAATNADSTNFIFLYDNEAGSGRPIAGTFVENDGTSGSSYAPFYLTNVNGIAKTWGAIIPNVLPNGIRRISHYSRATGTFINCNISADGVWAAASGGTVSTVNPVGGLTEIALNGTIVSLPILFKTISGNAASQGNTIFWSVSNAVNMANFEIQRSEDGRNYQTINKVSIGNQETFTYVDLNFIKKAFYRIKALDREGKINYSNTILIDSKVTNTEFSFYPNPATNFITLQHQVVRNNSNASIISLNGTIISQFNLPKGATQTQINVADLKAGTYILQYTNGTERIGKKLFKQ